MNPHCTIDDIRLELRRILGRLETHRPGTFVPPTPANPPIPSGLFHPFPEIFIQLRGCNDFTLPWMKFKLQAGRSCIIPAYTPHKERFTCRHGAFSMIVGMCNYETITWHMAYRDKNGPPQMTSSVICRIRDASRIMRLMDESAQAAGVQSKYARLQQRGSLLLTFSALLDALENTQTSLKYESHKVSFCKNLINEHLNQSDLCVKFLARRMVCSPNYLSSLFHQQTGIRLTDFINSRRLEQVRGLLRQSSMSIAEIARASGYSDPAYLTRIFVKKFGISPRLYRIHPDHP